MCVGGTANVTFRADNFDKLYIFKWHGEDYDVIVSKGKVIRGHGGRYVLLRLEDPSLCQLQIRDANANDTCKYACHDNDGFSRPNYTIKFLNFTTPCVADAEHSDESKESSSPVGLIVGLSIGVGVPVLVMLAVLLICCYYVAPRMATVLMDHLTIQMYAQNYVECGTVSDDTTGVD